MDYATKIDHLALVIAGQSKLLTSTEEEITALRTLPPGTVGVPQAINKLKTQAKRQQAALDASIAHQNAIVTLAQDKANHAKEQTKQTPKR